MDLVEFRGEPRARHPWETSRVDAIDRIIRRAGLPGQRVLDVGCGDGYLVRELCRRLGIEEAVAVDIHLPQEMADGAAAGRAPAGSRIRYVRTLDALDYRANLILLLDVLEHVEEPERILEDLKRERLSRGGLILITVPAFQCLFTSHDVALKHLRRYSRRRLLEDVTSAGLEVVDTGYLFSSLLVPRALTALKERLRSRAGADTAASYGVGEWSSPELVTRAVHTALSLDNRLCLAARGLGVTLPGLSLWMTCKVPS
jgi:2-polyprenyl-3-methyl-5-hydroxy-6-metoxy-1,4-benzoquinol methylase